MPESRCYNEAIKLGVACEYKNVSMHHGVMSVIGKRPLITNWKSGLCDCCGDTRHSSEQCRFFCCALWCQCCAQGELQLRSGLSDSCCVPCLFYCFTSSFSNIIPCIAMCNLHQSVAHASGIQEGSCNSCLKVCLCAPCALNQINSQLMLSGTQFDVDDRSGCNFSNMMGYANEKRLVKLVATNYTLPPNEMRC